MSTEVGITIQLAISYEIDNNTEHKVVMKINDVHHKLYTVRLHVCTWSTYIARHSTPSCMHTA